MFEVFDRRALVAYCAVAVICATACSAPGEAPADETSAPPERSSKTSERGPWWPASASDIGSQLVAAARADDEIMERLSELCDGFGPRPAGSEGLEQAIQWAAQTWRDDGLDSVTLQRVMVSVWERGEERATLLSPGPARALNILGLGNSVGTPFGGVRGELVVVRDFEHLESLGEQVAGKIVLYNYPMKDQPNMFASYGDAVKYRWAGAHRASLQGAAAVLVRSLTTRSLGTPHTGSMQPFGVTDPRPIPAAAVSLEDADALQRLADRGERIEVKLEMGARMLPQRASANVIGEIRGREKPDEVVVIGGHIDSWDVGTGAHDDGTGIVIVMETLRLMRELGLQPRRTVRGVLFTNEERGLDGAKGYFEQNRRSLETHVAAMETDSGGFAPRGFSFQGADEGFEQLEQVKHLFASIGELGIWRGGSGADIGPIVRAGVPGLGLRVESKHYFDYHHTDADTVDKVDPDELKESLAAFALMTWILADAPETLARAEPSDGNPS